MALLYIDSSVLVSMALGDQRGMQALAILGSRDSCTSELSAVECQAGLSFHYSDAPGGLPPALNKRSTLLLGACKRFR
jgi:hypothetical protein